MRRIIIYSTILIMTLVLYNTILITVYWENITIDNLINIRNVLMSIGIIGFMIVMAINEFNKVKEEESQ